MKIKYHHDAGHGWLAVKRKLLQDMELLGKITCFSYQRGKTVYLEEDQDAETFLMAAKKAGMELEIEHKHCDYSPIRSYDHFSFFMVMG